MASVFTGNIWKVAAIQHTMKEIEDRTERRVEKMNVYETLGVF